MQFMKDSSINTVENCDRIRDIVVAKLKSMGWANEDFRTSGLHRLTVMQKTYETDVGQKVAHVYFRTDTRPDEPDTSLRGDYMSEGRNALEPHAALIPKNADDATIINLTARFAINADRVIDDSYARRLLLSRSRKDSGPTIGM